jgi:polyribonucleotide nucleotidyltransferase
MFDTHKVEIEWGGRPLTLETGKVARQADGAVIASYGETTVLATVVSAKSPKPGQDFFPLTVNYQEKTYAAGKIPGGYLQARRPPDREGGADLPPHRPPDPPALSPMATRTRCRSSSPFCSHDLENNPDILAHGRGFGGADACRASRSWARSARRPRRLTSTATTSSTRARTRCPRISRLDLVVAGTVRRRSDGRIRSQGTGRRCQMLGAVILRPQELSSRVIDADHQARRSRCAKEPRDYTPSGSIPNSMTREMREHVRAGAARRLHQHVDKAAALQNKPSMRPSQGR